VAISREAGSRGGGIARKVAELLGWQLFNQETLDYLLQEDAAREQLLADLPGTARAWSALQMQRLVDERKFAPDRDTEAMISLILAIGARGDAVIVGRGAGYLLPAETTLHVRVIAPVEARIAYFAQWLRLNREEAAAEVRSRDQRRSLFLTRVLGRNSADVTGYDMIINSGRLGIEAAAQCIGWAMRTKQMYAELRETKESLSISAIPEPQ
jgi:cytidylate kinase